MQKLKGKKRLSILSIVFALVFMVGAAFALTPGTLDIMGTVNLDAELYVVWYNVDPEPIPPIAAAAFITDGSSHHTILEDARGRTDQRIIWNVFFVEPEDGEFMATLTATAMNNSTMDAVITQAVANWDNPALAAEWGLDLFVVSTAFVGTLLAGDESPALSVTVDWDGTFPATFTPGTDELPTFPLAIEFSYGPAPLTP